MKKTAFTLGIVLLASTALASAPNLTFNDPVVTPPECRILFRLLPCNEGTMHISKEDVEVITSTPTQPDEVEEDHDAPGHISHPGKEHPNFEQEEEFN